MPGKPGLSLTVPLGTIFFVTLSLKSDTESDYFGALLLPDLVDFILKTASGPQPAGPLRRDSVGKPFGREGCSGMKSQRFPVPSRK